MMEETTAPETESIDAPAEEAAPGPIKIKIGKVRNLMDCTLRLRGCKAPSMGNVFPIDHPHKDFRQPIANACSSCMNKMLDDQAWVVTDR